MASEINYFQEKPGAPQPTEVEESGTPHIIYDSSLSQIPWKIILSIIAVCLTLIGAGYYYFQALEYSVTNYAQCVKSGNPVEESYPAVCVTKGGRRFTEPLPSILPIPSLQPSPEASDSAIISSPSPETYSCPESGWVDCMPGPWVENNDCTPEALYWFNVNCPDFQGIAY